MLNGNLAVIDLGTNSCRLTITDNKGNMIYREAKTIKLGEGMSKNMCFTSEAIARGLSCFSHFAELMNDYEVKDYRAIATASCRMASNGAEFVKMVEECCGLKLDVISTREEAILNLRGAILNVPKNAEYVLVYDLGGGSTEITLAINDDEPKVLYTISIPLGARNSAEMFDLIEYDEEKANKLSAEVKKYVQDFLINSDFLTYLPNCVCVATSSTPLRLVSMVEKCETYDKSFADGLVANTNNIDEIIAGVYKMTLEEMSNSVYIGTNRAPIFVAACVIFQEIYKGLQIGSLMALLKGAQDAMICDLEKKWQS